MSRVAARVQMGYFNDVYEAEDACGIVREIEKNQDFDCLIGMAFGNGEKKREIKKLESFINRYREGSLTLEDIEKLEVHFSIGDIKCHGIARNEDEIAALKEQS